MKITYRFPAIRGIQASREYYIGMVPLGLLSRLFPATDIDILPEYRAQRRINEARIPDIKNYILNNRDTYVFSALSASIDGDFQFIAQGEGDLGILDIPVESVFLINDGQHRKAAIEAAIAEDESLSSETISVVFFADQGLARSQQMFTDLNKHAVKTSNSLSTLYDSRDSLAVATKAVIDAIPFFTRYTDCERDILGKNSSHLFTLNAVYKANQKILHGNICTEKETAFLIEYWTLVASNVTEWNEVMHKELTKKALRENYIITLAITLSALGKLGRFYYDHPDIDMQLSLSGLRIVDWSRSNKDWINCAIRENGKVLNNEDAIVSTYLMIKQYIGLPLSNEEKSRIQLKTRGRADNE